jgi:hypothetical protein
MKMTSTAKSVYYFSFYLLAAGLALFLIPNMILPIMGIVPTGEAWIRLVGVLTFILGVFFNYMAKNNIEKFFFISMYGRGIFSLAIFALIFFYEAPLQLLLFAAADLAGLMWTLLAYSRRKV